MSKRGYHDTSHISLERILGEEESVFKLTSGGEQKEALVRDIVSSLEEVNDQPAEEDMIAAIMETLGKEGTADDDVKREAAFALVTDPAFAEILTKHDSALYNRYVASIEHIEASQETVLGPVDALMEAGKTFAPVFARNVQQQRIIGIGNAWNACAARMEQPSVQRHIREELVFLERRLREALEERRLNSQKGTSDDTRWRKPKQ